jgi:dihydroorotate dehydrogenase (fumarate)
MTQIGSITIDPPIINTSCAWASSKQDLQGLFDCPFTGAVTTRTATSEGFKEDSTHNVGFPVVKSDPFDTTG